jgi:plastocyanin domain-containing protein
MSATLKTKLLVPVIAIALTGAAAAARAADDMAGMDHGKMGGTIEKDKRPAKDTGKKGGEKLEIAITDKGFEPDKLAVKKGQPVELVFTRKTDQTCIKEVVLDTGDGKKIQKPLPLNKPVSITTKFTKAGDLKYACSMNMFSGTVKVQ